MRGKSDTIPAFLAICLILIFCLPLFAQKETGVILGTITHQGVGLGGVIVTVSSPSLIGTTALASSNEQGFYRFPILPPGSYDIRVESAGFQTIIRKDLRLYVGNSLTIDFELQPAAVSEVVEIFDDAPPIDVTTTGISKTLPPDLIDKLPKSTLSWNMFVLTPGVGDDLVAYGGGGAQANAYWFDGVDVSDPVMGFAWQLPNYNWIQEVQVIGIGAPAEYGGFMGVVSNSVTRSGGNNFHGLIETFFQNESFTSSNTSESDLKPPNVDLFTDTSIQLGGPILRDKLWFFSGLEYYYKKEAPVGYPPSGGEAFAIAEEPKFINKLTFKMNESNTLQGFIEYETYDWSGVGAGPLRMPEATHNVDSPGWFWNAGWVSILNPETVVDVRTSGLWAEWDMLPRDLNLPGHAEITTGIRSVNHHFVYHSDRSRNQANASVSHHARDFIRGDHDFKFGVEYERSNAHQIANYAGGMWYYDYLGAPYYRVLWEGYDLSTDLNRLSAFAQDNWHITEKLNLSIGARWDHNNVTQEPSIEMTTNPIAPRVGFVYDLNGNQKTVIKAHYGHYYESAITFFTDQSGPINDVIVEWLNPATAQWEQIDRVVYQELVDPNIQQQYTQQLTAGLDQQIYGDITLGAHYIYRRDEDLVEDVEVLGIYEPFLWQNPLTGEMMTLFRRLNVGENQYVFTNPDAAYRRYHGFEITGRKRFSSRFLLSGSFVVSQSRGNLDNTDGGGTGFTRQFDSPNLNINYDGRLTNDITYEIKIMGYYDLPWGINSSWYYRHFTGDTWTPTYRVSGLVQESNVNVFLLPRGSYRLPSRNVLDWRIEKSFPFYNGNLKFTADIFNVFNTGYPLRVQNRFDLNYEEPLQFSFPREIRLGIRYQF